MLGSPIYLALGFGAAVLCIFYVGLPLASIRI